MLEIIYENKLKQNEKQKITIFFFKYLRSKKSLKNVSFQNVPMDITFQMKHQAISSF